MSNMSERFSDYLAATGGARLIDIRSPLSVQRVSSIGDSLHADAGAITATGSSWVNWGRLAWFRRAMGKRIDFPLSRQYGAASKKLADVIADQLPLVLADASNVVIDDTGTNDIDATTLANIIARKQLIFDSILAAGKTLVAIGLMAHKPATEPTAAGKKQTAYVNEWISRYCRTHPRAIYYTPDPYILDFSNGYPAAAYFRDGTHHNLISAKIDGFALAALLKTYFPAPNDTFTSLNDVYHATDNTSGNLLANGLMAGTAGTVGTGTSGSVPTSWNALRSGPATHTTDCSKEAYPAVTGLEKAVMTFGGTGNSGNSYFQQDIIANLTAGDSIELEVEVDWSFVSAGFAGINALIRIQDVGNALLMLAEDGSSNYINGGFAANDSGSMLLRTSPITVPVGATAAYVRLVTNIAALGTPDGYVRWARASVRKIA